MEEQVDAVTPERWRQVERLYYDALAVDAGARAAWLEEACPRTTVKSRDDQELERWLAVRDGIHNYLITAA